MYKCVSRVIYLTYEKLIFKNRFLFKQQLFRTLILPFFLNIQLCKPFCNNTVWPTDGSMNLYFIRACFFNREHIKAVIIFTDVFEKM